MEFIQRAIGGLVKLGASAVMFWGSYTCVQGIISIGFAIRDGAIGGGEQMHQGVTRMTSGAIIAAAGIIFGGFDLSWISFSW